MPLKRNWTELATRWFGERINFDVERTIQPVAIVEDVSQMSLPPTRTRRHVGGIAAGPTAAQNSTFLLYYEPAAVAQDIAASTALFVEAGRFVQSTGAIFFGTWNAATLARPTLTGAVVTNPVRLETPVDVAYRDVAVFEYGTTATALNVGDECGAFVSGQAENLTRLGIWVLPQQYFWVQLSDPNVVLTCTYLQWSEYRINLDQLSSQYGRLV